MIDVVQTLRLRWLAGRFAVARLDADAPVPDWATGPADLLCLARTTEELAIIAPQDRVPPPDQVTAERDFVALRVVGTLAFSMVGVLAQLTGVLADANISVVVVSTYDTDYVLVRAADGDRATTALTECGFHWQV